MKRLKPTIAFRYLQKYQKQLQKLVAKGKFQTLTAKKRKQWISKVERLQKQLSKFIHFKQVKKLVAGTSFMLSLAFSQNVSAQNFLAPLTNPFGLNSSSYITVPTAVDIDNDGDFDILIGEYYGTLSYYENTGTAASPSFTQNTTVFSGISGYYYAFPTFVDVDNDGDFDLFITEEYSAVNYYENIGTATNPSFGAAQPNPFGINLASSGYFSKMNFVDLDGDGDFDLIAGGYNTSILYQENIGTQTAPNFSTPQISPFGINPLPTYGAIAEVTDIDGDGDFDIIIGKEYGALQYYENTGTTTMPTFAANVLNPFNLNFQNPSTYVVIPDFVDLDGDGDLDMIAGLTEANGGSVIYAENTLIAIPNNIPTSADTSKQMNQDEVLGFVVNDFPFSDADVGETLAKIRFKSTPTNGQLSIAGFPAGVNVEVTAAQFVQMTYTPNTNFFGTDNFQFEVSDGTDFSATHNFTININGLPTSAAGSITTEQDIDYTFATTDFVFNDADGGTFESVQITSLPTKGTIKLNGNSVITGQTITVSDLPNMTYSPIAGETGFPYTDFQFAVSDGQGFSQSETMTITVEFPSSTDKLVDFATIQLSPNPTRDAALLQIQSTNITSATFTIQNLAGQIIKTELVEINENFTKNIDVSQFTKGVYLISLKTNDGKIWTEKLLIE